MWCVRDLSLLVEEWFPRDEFSYPGLDAEIEILALFGRTIYYGSD
jgi:hypothetical protein